MVWNHSKYGDLANFLPEGIDHLRELSALLWNEWKRRLPYCFLASDIPDWSGDCYFEKAKINKEDKHGLGSLRRNKKRFEAQQMMVLLEALAHNLLVWVRGWLADACPRLARWGLLRWIRDAIHISGVVVFHSSKIVQIVLNRGDPVAGELGPGLAALLAPEETAIILGEI
jgi:hypothetical protein